MVATIKPATLKTTAEQEVGTGRPGKPGVKPQVQQTIKANGPK